MSFRATREAVLLIGKIGRGEDLNLRPPAPKQLPHEESIAYGNLYGVRFPSIHAGFSLRCSSENKPQQTAGTKLGKTARCNNTQVRLRRTDAKRGIDETRDRRGVS